jgi:hypothetical protein
MARHMQDLLRQLARAFGVFVALAAVAVVAAPGASAHGKPPLRSSLTMTLEIYDAYTSQACGQDVFANVTFTEQRNVFLGETTASPARELTTYDGDIQWFVRGTGKSYSDKLKSVLSISYPQGIELWAPARVTVVGRNGGTFPIGDSPAGTGLLVYDATVNAEDQGFPYWFVNGGPIAKLGTFDFTTQRICAALK